MALNHHAVSPHLPYYKGLESLLGKKTLHFLQQSHVLIIGLGGVGSWVAESLVRTGLRELTLVDLDDLCLSNINRQVHALYSTHGKMKVDVLAQRLLDINPHLMVHTHSSHFSEKNADYFFNIPYQAVIDACDDFKAKLLLCIKAREHQQYLLTIGAAGGKTDPTQIRIGDLTQSTNDKILARLKKKLRQEHAFPRTKPFHIDAVWSNQRAIYPNAEGKLCYEPNRLAGVKLDCELGMGSASFLTGSMAFFAVYAVVKYWQEQYQLKEI